MVKDNVKFKRGMIAALCGAEGLFFMMGFMSNTMTWSPWIFLGANAVVAGIGAVLYGIVMVVDSQD